MLVFRGTNDGFTFVSASTITNEPIRVSPENTQGWKTLIVHSKGKGDVLMQFNGTHYPLNPSLQSKATAGQVEAAELLLK
jgi:putative lipoprotein